MKIHELVIHPHHEIAALFEALALRQVMLTEGQLDEAGIWDKIKSAGGAVIGGVKNANDAVNRLGQLAQQTKPVQNFDAQADAAIGKIAAANPKLADTARRYGEWAKQNPVKQGLIIGALTAAASQVAGPAGGAAAGYVFRAANELLKGEKASTAVGKGLKTAAVGAVAGAIAHWGLDKIGDMLSQSLPAAPKPFIVKGLVTLDYSGTMGSGHLVGPPEQIAQIRKLQYAAFDALNPKGLGTTGDPAKAAEYMQQAQNIINKLPELSKKVIADQEAGKAAYDAAFEKFRVAMANAEAYNQNITSVIDRLKTLASAGASGAAASGLVGGDRKNTAGGTTTPSAGGTAAGGAMGAVKGAIGKAGAAIKGAFGSQPQTQQPAAAQTPTRSGGRVAGQPLSQTPGAVKKRAARAAAKAQPGTVPSAQPSVAVKQPTAQFGQQQWTAQAKPAPRPQTPKPMNTAGNATATFGQTGGQTAKVKPKRIRKTTTESKKISMRLEIL